MISVSFRNLVSLIIVMLWGKYGDSTEYQSGQEGKAGVRV